MASRLRSDGLTNFSPQRTIFGTDILSLPLKLKYWQVIGDATYSRNGETTHGQTGFLVYHDHEVWFFVPLDVDNYGTRLVIPPAAPKDRATQCPVSKTQVTSASFCDVVSNPSRFHGKLLRVKANFLVGGETRILHDPKCKGEIWVEFDNVLEACTDHELLRRLWRQDSVPHDGLFNGLQESEIVAVGLFLHDDAGFGHMNAYKDDLTIKWLEEVKSLSKGEVTIDK